MSLTGALRIGATFLSRFPAASAPKAIYIPNPTVEEEAFAIRDSGLEINLYRFFDRRTGGVDWDGMREDIRNAPEQSIILLHVGGSTPTGAELSTAQWRLITEVIKVNLKSGGRITLRLSKSVHFSRDSNDGTSLSASWSIRASRAETWTEMLSHYAPWPTNEYPLSWLKPSMP